MIRVNVSVADATVTEKETLTAGRVGLACAFTFSSEWDGLQKIAVFEGADSKSVALMESDETVVPWECMAEAGYKLSVGVVGKNAQGDIVIPTVWARVGKIQLSPDDVPEGEEPTPSVVAQIEQAAANALMLARSVKEAADNGEFDGAQGPQGEKGDTGDPAGISRVYVDVDNGTGTPFANASVSGPDTAKQISFYFHNLKGPQGETGPAGEILSMTATVDNNTGTPSVGVTQMGTPSARRYSLQFHNLKGAKGDKGDTGSTGPAGSTGPVGPQGPAGVGVPAGGMTGQVLKKASGTNYDTEWGDAGSSITVDDALSPTSENPVQNKVVDAALGTKLPTNGNAYRSASIPMGHLDSTSTATVMTATVDGITELRDGVCMWLRNGVVNSASGFTLNVNGLGAKPLYGSLTESARATTTFTKAYTLLLIYNSTRVEGGCWDIVYGIDTNTTYTPQRLGFGYGTCTTAAATVAKTATVTNYTLTVGGIVAIKFDNDVPAGATLNITSKGAKAIYYKGAAITAGVIKAGDTVTMIYSTYYHVLSIDRDADTQPPQPSDATPASIGASSIGSPGSSNYYARADHAHEFDLKIMLEENIGAYVDMLILPSGATDGSPVYVQASLNGQQFASYAIISGMKHIAYFLIPLTQDPTALTDFQVVAEAATSKIYQTANGLGIQFNGIADGKLYSVDVVLPWDSNAGSGTLSVTNLALPSAQGVSF